MKLSPCTVLAFCLFLPQAFIGQNVQVVVGQKAEFGQRQPIPTPEIGVPATPLATFATHEPTAGISNQERLGVTGNTETTAGVVSTLTPPPLVYQNATIWSVPETTVTPVAAQQQPQEEAMLADLVPSSFVGATSQEKEPSISLGEVAAQYKAMRRAKNVRVFSNTD